MRKGVMQLASIGALFAAMSSAAAKATATVDELKDALGEIVPNRRRRSRKGKGKRGRSLRSNSPSLAYISRQRTKRRWLAGLPVDADAREALEAAQTERARKNAKRAYMFRRQEEGPVVRAAWVEAGREYDETPEGTPGGRCQGPKYSLARRLQECWDERMPLEIVLGAQQA